MTNEEIYLMTCQEGADYNPQDYQSSRTPDIRANGTDIYNTNGGLVATPTPPSSLKQKANTAVKIGLALSLLA